jgi:phage-related protein
VRRDINRKGIAMTTIILSRPAIPAPLTVRDLLAVSPETTSLTCYTKSDMMRPGRIVRFHPGAVAGWKALPGAVRERAIHELDSLCRGERPADARPFRGVGSGVIEIRIRKGGAFRVVCAVGFDEAVYVLVAFEKKSRKTPRRVIELIRRRYRQTIRGREGGGFYESSE